MINARLFMSYGKENAFEIYDEFEYTVQINMYWTTI